MRDFFRYLIILVAAVLVSSGIIVFSASTTTIRTTQMRQHFFGGFNITDAQMAIAATGTGITEAQMYDAPASSASPFGQTLQALHMHEIDSYIWTLLFQYECHRSKLHQPPGSTPYCQEDYPHINTLATLFQDITWHLQRVRNNALIDAYWVIDGWPAWDYGSARLILQQIHALIQQWTPNKPALCGFGGVLGLHVDYWDDQEADNFSPQGCDMVGIYVYSAYLSPTVSPAPSSNAFDWSMSSILPKIFHSLSRRGWNKQREPFIAIAQGFSGTIASTGWYLVTPNAQNLATQALAFCRQGASAVFFYAWNTDRELLQPQTPMNNSLLADGVKQAVTVCTRYWS